MAYAKAPITEAVLELVFAEPVNRATIESAARRVESKYPQKDVEETAEFAIDPKAKQDHVSTKWAWMGLKLNSADRADIIFYRPDRFLCARLAPYTGWENFIAKAVDALAAWKKSAGSLEVKRVGLRYLNRIDVPDHGQLIEIEKYLNVAPKAPLILDQPMSAYTVQMTRSLGADDCTLNLISATVASPLVGHTSFALDIDVFRESNIPRREEELWALVDRMRSHKNRIFEACVTDNARELFK
jgi:uncharacterized protein (TIGR04255 family)